MPRPVNGQWRWELPGVLPCRSCACKRWDVCAGAPYTTRVRKSSLCPCLFTRGPGCVCLGRREPRAVCQALIPGCPAGPGAHLTVISARAHFVLTFRALTRSHARLWQTLHHLPVSSSSPAAPALPASTELMRAGEKPSPSESCPSLHGEQRTLHRGLLAP